MAMEHVAKIIVKMQDAQQNNISQEAASYFDHTFKTHFRNLERSIQNNWRLHRAYFEAQGQLCVMTNSLAEAREIVTVMLNTIKGKACSLPVRKLICEKLALMVTTR